MDRQSTRLQKKYTITTQTRRKSYDKDHDSNPAAAETTNASADALSTYRETFRYTEKKQQQQ